MPRAELISLLLGMSLTFFGAFPVSVFAQDAAAEEAAEEGSGEESEEQYLKGSTETTMQTIDGVYLNIRLWLPEKKTIEPKETPVVILMHMRGKSQSDWYPYAKYLQQSGLAVCTFDFRGHGQSRETNPEVYVPVGEAMKKAIPRDTKDFNLPSVPEGKRRVEQAKAAQAKTKGKKSGDSLDQGEEFRTGKDLAFALPVDLQTVKEYLVVKHNEGMLNIRRLGIVGAEMSCAILLDWMASTEFKPDKARGWDQVDSDVSAIVLLSPPTNYLGYKPPTSFSTQGEEVPMMIVSGNERKSADDAVKLARKLRIAEFKPTSEDEKKKEAPRVKPRGKERQGSGWITLDSKFIGTDLMRPPINDIDKMIRDFLKAELSKDKGRNWQRRKLDPDRAGFGEG